MILLWFVLGIVLAFGIARYNESNKLFWTLLFAFIMGFAGTKMLLDVTHNGNEKDNGSLVQVYSTQVSATTLNMLSCHMMSKTNPVVTAQKLVSKSFIPVEKEKTVILSKIFGKVRDQPTLNLIKPPELCLQKTFSTLHDST